MNFHNKAGLFLLPPALAVLLKASRGLLRLITFLFCLSKLKTAPRRPSSRNQLISFDDARMERAPLSSQPYH